MLYGRPAEQAMIDGLLADARARRSGALVVRGEPGIGKTALLGYAARAADQSNIRVIRGAGAELEAGLPFAGLHLLLRPVLDRRFALPQPQQDALSAALGLKGGPRCDRFLVGLAVLSLLAELAGDGPLVCLADDAHWLDRASVGTLLFAARRLGAEGIVIIFAARPDLPFPASGLTALELGGLDPASAATLVMAHGGAGLTPSMRSRILAESCGNPLALIELAGVHLNAPCGADRPAADPAVSLTGRLQEAFGSGVRRLPANTRTLLLVAAAEVRGDLGVILEAGKALGVTATAMAPAERAGLIRTGDGRPFGNSKRSAIMPARRSRTAALRGSRNERSAPLTCSAIPCVPSICTAQQVIR